jgi:hypothetical protein
MFGHFAQELRDERQAELPRSVTILSDPQVSVGQVRDLVNGMGSAFKLEFARRRKRASRFVGLGLMSESEVVTHLTRRTHVQPWIVYFSKDGGLGATERNSDTERVETGLFPCSAMTNHGIGWRRSDGGQIEAWLVTDRKRGDGWDWDSDIGHESAHAGFAPIPLFAQGIQLLADRLRLSGVRGTSELGPEHLARICYACSELAVVAVRGEQRATPSGLPVVEQKEDAHAFLRICDELMPRLGFRQALHAYEASSGQLDIEAGSEIFAIGTAALRAIPRISRWVCSLSTPTLEMLSIGP